MIKDTSLSGYGFPGQMPGLLKGTLSENFVPVNSEEKASLSLADELSSALLERCREAFSGEQFSVRVLPSFENFGAVAQIRVVGISQVSRMRVEPQGLPLLQEQTLAAQFFLPAILRGRAGCRPQELQLNLAIGAEVFRAAVTLFVGIRRAA